MIDKRIMDVVYALMGDDPQKALQEFDADLPEVGKDETPFGEMTPDEVLIFLAIGLLATDIQCVSEAANEGKFDAEKAAAFIDLHQGTLNILTEFLANILNQRYPGIFQKKFSLRRGFKMVYAPLPEIA